MKIELDLRKRFGTASVKSGAESGALAVDEIAVQLHSDARILALFGRSGAGKSSVLNMIAGLLAPDSGSLKIDGVTLFDAAQKINQPVERRGIGVVFQQAHLFPHLTVRGNLLYGAKRSLETTPRSAPSLGFEQVITLLGIDNLLTRKPAALSGGEKQRVAIGRALLSSPSLLLMDEPLASLDVARRSELLRLIERVRDELGTRIIYVSHSIGEVTRLADEVALLHQGKLLAHGKTEDIFNRADLRPHTGRYEGGALLEAVALRHDARYFMTTFRVGDERSGFELLAPGIDVAIGQRVRIRIRARDVTLALTAPQGISIRNVLSGTITNINHSGGAIVEVRVRIADQAELPARISRLSLDQLGLQVGQTVVVLIKAIAFDKRSMGLTT